MNRSLRFLSLLVCVMFAQQAMAYDFMVDGIAYNINPDGKTVRVTNTLGVTISNDDRSSYYSGGGFIVGDEYYSYFGNNYKGVEDVAIPASVTNRGITYMVTEIESCALVAPIVRLTIGKNVNFIDEYAIYGPEELTLEGTVDFIADNAMVSQPSFDSRNFGTIYLDDGVTSIAGMGTNTDRIISYADVPPICGPDFPTYPEARNVINEEDFLYTPFARSYVYVPENAVSSYLSAPYWKDCAYRTFSGVKPTSVSILDAPSSITLKQGELYVIHGDMKPYRDLPLFWQISTGEYIQVFEGHDSEYAHSWEETGFCRYWPQPLEASYEYPLPTNIVGEYDVCACFGNLKSNVVHVVVTNKDVVKLDKSSLHLEVGENAIINVLDCGGYLSTPTNSDPSVASISVSGMRIRVVALKEGKTVITVPGSNGYLPATCEVTVGNGGEQPNGDVTGDGEVDIADVNLCINMMLGKADQTTAADVSGDGSVDIADVNAVINLMLGK